MAENNNYYVEFDKKFHKYKSDRIAIYGTGLNAKLIAENVFDYNILGYISRELPCDFVDKEKVIILDDALESADIIIIAATVQSTKIVYTRIKNDIPKNIKILDLFGNELNIDETIALNPYWNKSFEELCQQIKKYDVISFDIFDTLIMRRVLQPTDIHDECETSFSKSRREAEIRMNNQLKAATIDEIYEAIGEELNIEKDILSKNKEKEFQLEKKVLCARTKMFDALKYANELGKKIVLTSDMYYSSESIRDILLGCGIECDNLIVSCEHRKSKIDGSIYEILRKEANGHSVLHIGDNKILDGVNANGRGIDSYLIKSAYDLFCDSAFVSLLDTVQTKDDRRYLGYMISKLLNNPFALTVNKGKLEIKNEQDLAQIVYPITRFFIDYIIEQSREFDCIVFPSRDGYFLYEMYMEEKRANPDLPDAVYLYASRMAMSRAAVHDIKSYDILLGKLFTDSTLNCQEYFRNQFLVELPDEFNDTSGELIRRYGKKLLMESLNGFYDEVVFSLEGQRERYQRYVNELGFANYDNFGMIDIVSYGTQIFCLSEILGKKVTMISMGTTGVPNMFIGTEDVRSVYGNINSFSSGSVYSNSDFATLHLILEMLYASTEGQFCGFDRKGEADFLEGTEYNSELVVTFQEYVKTIDREYKSIWEDRSGLSSDFVLNCLRLLLSRYSEMDSDLKNKFVFFDPYMGQMKKLNLAESL